MKSDHTSFELFDIVVIIATIILVVIVIAFGLWRPTPGPATFDVGINSLGHVR
jgi:hypothetical protein